MNSFTYEELNNDYSEFVELKKLYSQDSLNLSKLDIELDELRGKVAFEEDKNKFKYLFDKKNAKEVEKIEAKKSLEHLLCDIHTFINKKTTRYQKVIDTLKGSLKYQTKILMENMLTFNNNIKSNNIKIEEGLEME